MGERWPSAAAGSGLSSLTDLTDTEWSIVADAKSWMDALREAHGDQSPFGAVKVETRASSSLKRRDLTITDRAGRICLTGEVKVPWAADGASPFVESTVVDARKKAAAVHSPWFFTWNLNELVLWRSGGADDPHAPRQYKTYDFTQLRASGDLKNPRLNRELRDGVERFFLDFMRLFRGDIAVVARAPDEFFVRQFESFLIWPILTATSALVRRDGNPAARAAVDRWMREEQGWPIVGDRHELLGRAARFACYAVANKLVFYDALRKRFSDLPELTIGDTITTGEGLTDQLSTFFDIAREVTGDYETVFGSIAADTGARLPFHEDTVVGHWREFAGQLGRFDLSRLDYDVIGRIFERLIDPAERHKFGQFYTRPEVVDIINAFAIRDGEATVLDPGCGGGTFLVRAYARKKRLAPRLGHRALLEGVYGTDISPFAAHLSTINLATRDLIEDANYPRVRRGDFFDLAPGSEFLLLPGRKRAEPVAVPRFDAIIGNPPYVRQEDVPTDAKARYATRAKAAGLNANGRSDLHVYFWGHALSLMKPDATLGFLASSQWLDAEYGFQLQAWLLEHFRVRAIIESREEPWFVGARVETAATIAERESDPEARDDNLIRFVQVRRPMAKLLQGDGTNAGALQAAEEMRDAILRCSVDTLTENWRVRVRRQGDLRAEGVRLGQRTKNKPVYAGGKWGIPLRAPDLWEELLKLGGARWKPLAELAEVRFGVKSGCDDFFYVGDHSAKGLAEFADAATFEAHYGVPRALVETGAVTLAMTGTKEVHPIETCHLVPIVHSLMDIDAYVIERRHCRSLALMVGQSQAALQGTYIGRYIEWGENRDFDKGATCRARGESREWYNLRPDVIPADTLWVKERQYRFAAPANPKHFAVNCRLYTITYRDDLDKAAQAAVMNSSLVFLATLMFGRPVGVEGNWSTMVLDANMLQVPSVAGVSDAIRARIMTAHDKLAARSIIGLLSQRRLRRKTFEAQDRRGELAQLSDESELTQADRRALDDAVLELLGVTSARERTRLVDALHAHLAQHFEAVRVKEEEAIDNKAKAARQGAIGADEIVTDVIAEIERDHPALLRDFTAFFQDPNGDGLLVPSTGEPVVVEDLVTMGVRFATGRGGELVKTYSREQAELLATIAAVGPRGRRLFVPRDPTTARPLVERMVKLALERATITHRLVADRTADPDLQERAAAMVRSRLIAGISRPRRAAGIASAQR